MPNGMIRNPIGVPSTLPIIGIRTIHKGIRKGTKVQPQKLRPLFLAREPIVIKIKRMIIHTIISTIQAVRTSLSIDLEVYTSATYEVISNKKKWVALSITRKVSPNTRTYIDRHPLLS